MARKQRKEPKYRAEGMQSSSSKISDSKVLPPQITKSSSDTATYAASGDPELRPKKRPKLDHDFPFPASLIETSITQNSLQAMPEETGSPKPLAFSLPSEIKHLQGEFDISTMSIISSSKINQKVKALLDRVEKFTFADVNARPGIVVVEAKAAVASKMISVVEIAKADIAKRHGKWYEYTKLRSELLPLKVKRKQKKQPPGGNTPANGEDTQDAMGIAPQASTMGTANDLEADKEVDLEDEAEAFETMQEPYGGATTNEKARIRATPVMTIYFSCVPVPGLKEVYG
ncbi:MAG: hypothetical protein L6R41_001515 [Letrouitia leprolyta]|nr:MAG: hypothetical protein L6R41_001515 [Letrouitia leprolyta]